VVVPADLKGALADADALIVRSATKVTEELLTHAPKLRLVARGGVGLDNVDKAACGKRGIKVANTPGASTNSVAELALGMMFCVSRKIAMADQGMRGGKWLKKEAIGTELEGKTLGIVGLGRIGNSLALKARAMGMKVIYYDPHHKGETVLGSHATLDTIFTVSDYISLHVPLTPETKNMINAGAISKMKKTAILINTARGGLVDEEALYNALSEGRIAGAGLDVFPSEPYNGKLCGLPNAVLTPHVGGSTKEAQARIGQELIAVLRSELG